MRTLSKKRMMLKVLKNSILIVLLVLTGSVGSLANGQDLSLQEARLERKSYRNEVCETSAIPLLLFMHENCELSLGYSHVVPDSKSQLVPFFLQRSNKNDISARSGSKQNLYFHPYSTLGKTKYYVFALREIIV